MINALCALFAVSVFAASPCPPVDQTSNPNMKFSAAVIEVLAQHRDFLVEEAEVDPGPIEEAKLDAVREFLRQTAPRFDCSIALMEPYRESPVVEMRDAAVALIEASKLYRDGASEMVALETDRRAGRVDAKSRKSRAEEYGRKFEQSMINEIVASDAVKGVLTKKCDIDGCELSISAAEITQLQKQLVRRFGTVVSKGWNQSNGPTVMHAEFIYRFLHDGRPVGTRPRS
jgi:hypothetical protein